MANHTNIIGPNIFPMVSVPNCCKKNKAESITITIATISNVVMPARPGICRNPSTAEVTETGGVMMPSANNDAPPIVAGNTSHFRRRLTSAYKLNIPPSPLLSAFRVSITYLSVVCNVSVQIMQDKEPRMSGSFMT